MIQTSGRPTIAMRGGHPDDHRHDGHRGWPITRLTHEGQLRSDSLINTANLTSEAQGSGCQSEVAEIAEVANASTVEPVAIATC